MTKAPTFHTTVNIEYTDACGRDHECEVEVTYTYDGADDLRIVKCVGDCFNGWDESIVEDLIYDAVCDVCGEEYADWEADFGEYLNDQREDARIDLERTA